MAKPAALIHLEIRLTLTAHYSAGKGRVVLTLVVDPSLLPQLGDAY